MKNELVCREVLLAIGSREANAFEPSPGLPARRGSAEQKLGCLGVLIRCGDSVC
jgi:hypothetical protein